MTGPSAEALAPVGPVDRVLGQVRGGRPGPMLLCIGGLHGNEPAGVYALRSVLKQLEAMADQMAGDFVALAGNRAALAEGRRFVERDLNRAWTPERVEALRNGAPKGVEDQEQVELLDAIEEMLDGARGAVYVLDLHTTSGPGAPFSTFGDTLPNRAFADHLPVPMILGLEELVHGTLLGFLGAHGLVAVAYESGQHVEPMAVERAEAGIWIALAAAGLFTEQRLPMVGEARRLLQRDTLRLPRALEMRYRHDVEPEDGFAMKPGYANFRPVVEGEVLARDRRGDVAVTETSRVLMPLYQEQGEDGFFLVREFSAFWLRVSYILRALQMCRMAPLLPGVRQVGGSVDTVEVNKNVARWYAKQFFHLLGFREVDDRGGHLVMRRRRFDEARLVRMPPQPEELE